MNDGILKKNCGLSVYWSLISDDLHMGRKILSVSCNDAFSPPLSQEKLASHFLGLIPEAELCGLGHQTLQLFKGPQLRIGKVLEFASTLQRNASRQRVCSQGHMAGWAGCWPDVEAFPKLIKCIPQTWLIKYKPATNDYILEFLFHHEKTQYVKIGWNV